MGYIDLLLFFVCEFVIPSNLEAECLLEVGIIVDCSVSWQEGFDESMYVSLNELCVEIFSSEHLWGQS